MAQFLAKARASMDAKWLAGFMDGEGTFTASRRSSTHTKRITWTPLVSVSNTNEAILRDIVATFGGYFAPRPQTRNPQYKPLYQVRWADAKAAPIIRLVLPYLRLKQEQARLVLALAENIQSEGIPGCKGHPVGVIEFRSKIASTVQRLNQRGVVNG